MVKYWASSFDQRSSVLLRFVGGESDYQESGGQNRPTPTFAASAVEKRTVILCGRKTSVSVEDAFWNALREIALTNGTTRRDLINAINQTRSNANLSSAIRLFVLAYYQGSGR